MSSDISIVVVGSINMDLVSRTERIPLAGETVSGSSFQTYPGGKGANQAVAIARLGHPVRLIGRVGTDAFGYELRRGLEEAGVDVAGVGTVGGASGVAAIMVSAAGENCIVVTAGANASLLPEELDEHLEVIRSAGMVLTQLETPLATTERLAAICEAAGVPLMLDPAPACVLPPELLTRVTWFTPNESEAAFYLGAGRRKEEAVRGLRELGPRNIALKLGERGVYLLGEGGMEETLPAHAVEAVDTTAAGDAFNGAFAVGLVEGRSPKDSARFAAAAAAIAVTRHGAQPAMASRSEVEALLRSGSSR